MNEPIIVDRPPRIWPPLPFAEIEIPQPPDQKPQGLIQLIRVALPLLTIIGYILISTMGGVGRNPWFMIPMGLSVVGSVAFSIYSYVKEKQLQREMQLQYQQQLTNLTKEMNQYHDQQRRFYEYNYPAPGSTLRIVEQVRRNVEKTENGLRSESRLWERRVSDKDFGVIRLGMGTLSSTVVYTLKDSGNSNNPQWREATKLAATSRYVEDIPITLALRPNQEEKNVSSDDEDFTHTPIAHALGIAGGAQSIYAFVRSMLAYFAVFHAPTDAKLYVLASNKKEWAWTDDLPHTQTDDQGSCCCFVDSVRGAADTVSSPEEQASAVEQFLEGLRKILAQRKIRLQEQGENEDTTNSTLPFLLVIVDLQDAVRDPSSPLHNIEADAAISILQEDGAALGAAVIFLVPERSKIPSSCRALIEIEETALATNRKFDHEQTLHFRYAEVDMNSFRYVGRADHITMPGVIDSLAQKLAPLKIRQGFGANLKKTVSFLELMEYDSIAELEAKSWADWQDSISSESADWLEVRLGRMSGNKPRTLIFSARQDGVHGMIAGSTGSGKSELLIALIIGMAVRYDPTVLNFVLVDFKGGGAFKPLADLPHCVDIITNLEGDGVTRMFTAIQAELERRQELLNTATANPIKDIVQYRKEKLHQTRQPLPFLFIIIDEFAEMIAERSDYRAQLETITRIGRSLGVSLILAAQRPSGVTDQMRANIKFRVCLRVETPAESREMLRRTEAAYLPSNIPGRGYLQVGNDEIELIQVAYTGDKYTDPNQTPVLWPGRKSYDETQDQEPIELYKVIVSTLARLAQANDIEQQYAPWPDFLPTNLPLTALLDSKNPKLPTVTAKRYLDGQDLIMLGEQRALGLTLNPAVNRWLDGEAGWLDSLDWERYALRPVVGLVDNPYSARQMPLVINFRRGNVVIFGASGWGKTTFIRTLLISLTATHSPNHVHIYLLDLGGRNLGPLANLPHVGAFIIPDESAYKERVEQLVRQLNEIVVARTALLNDAGVSDLYQYNQLHPGDIQPAIVVVIDNFLEFRETFDNGSDSTESVLDRFTTLVRQSRPYGIHFVVSASQLNTLSNSLFNLFTERFTLRLTDPADYRAIVGGPVVEIGEIPGRGYSKIGRRPLSFQVAQPLGQTAHKGKKVMSENQRFEQLAQTMTNYINLSENNYCRPLRVDALPGTVLFKQILARKHPDLNLDPTFLGRLTAITKEQWAKSVAPAHTDWLEVTLGVTSGNRLSKLKLEAKEHGVHGLIAGGTGSGKSELLMTLIVDLALKYDPSILNFVLIDYKGGSTFKPFERLPHVVEMVTNLNNAAVRRMFTAIKAEMQRRQKLNVDTNTSHIVEYRSKGFHLTRQPYPHLFIIIDEYAEMITANPEFKHELEQITRVGRSLGVNLLLASQRPVGVTDQMRANIKFRICLRVEDAETSRETLRRTDAANLPHLPGRGYLQVGNTNLELIQVAFAGEPFEYIDVPQNGEKPKFYDVVVDLANELLTGERPRTPWPPFLPPALSFSKPLIEEYIGQNHRSLVTLNQSNDLSLNPFLRDWHTGQGVWPSLNWSKTAMRAVVGVLDDPYSARLLPLVVDFTKGHSIIFGASGWGKTTFLRSLILSLASTHSPNTFQAHILDLGGRNLEALSCLPHVGTIIMPDERGYEEQIQQLWRELNEIIEHRRHCFSEAGVSNLYEYNQGQAEIEPAILVIIDNFNEFLESFNNPSQANDESNLLAAFSLLARQAKAYGIHFVISVDRPNALSSKLYSLFSERLTLRLSDSGQYSAVVGSQVTEIEEIVGRGCVKFGGRPHGFQVALPPGTVDDGGHFTGGEVQQIQAVGQEMSRFIEQSNYTYRQPFRIGALPKTSSYRQLLTEMLAINRDDSFIGQLKTLSQAAWARNASAEHADWLKVTLGISSGNKKKTLHLEAKHDGVHGLIAGGTGSGKSELLMTMIVGLALNYSPEILNFVLVDYKGGDAFIPFKHLPHCVDLVTNLNRAAVSRMFTAINAEIDRRMALNSTTRTKDIVEYRQENFHRTRQPYPHLFVIIDEYAEMIDDFPEYRAELERIARVGRALGINLVLASQKPKGVSDQMRANIKLRLCLKVEDKETSREVIQRPDAHYIPDRMPGRGYLQIGSEPPELLQVSYAGDPQPDDRQPPVLWPKRSKKTESTNEGENLKFHETAVKLAAELTNGQMAPKPWPGFLPNNISLQSPLSDPKNQLSFTLEPAITDWLNGDTAELWPAKNWQQTVMRPVVGLADDPTGARQDPLSFDLTRNHLAVFGDSGWGKTTFLRTLLVCLSATHSPDEFHAYVLDLGGRNFNNLKNLPHVGAVIYADDENYEEKLERLLSKLNTIVNSRQKLLATSDAKSLYDYNDRYPEQTLPAIVVIIDNFAELKENYETLVDTVLLPLVRRALGVGISFVASSNTPSNMPNKLYNLFGERITFKQANKDRYLDIVGRGTSEIDDLPGRGYVRLNKRPLQFQIALPVGIFDSRTGLDSQSESEELRRIASCMQTRIESRGWRVKPEKIGILPEHVSLKAMLDVVEPCRNGSIQILLGQGGDLAPTLIDLKSRAPHCAIFGPPLSGKTTSLYSIVLSLTYRYSPERVKLILIDTQRKFAEYGGQCRLNELPHVLTFISEPGDLEQTLPVLKTECERLAEPDSNQELFVIIDNFDDFSEEMSKIDVELARLARRYRSEGLHFIISGLPSSSSTSSLRKQVLSANFGIGLRTPQSLEALRVTQIPAELRNKPLPMGRGYCVYSGQTSLIQIATPLNTIDVDSDRYLSHETDTLAEALDKWTRLIQARYPKQQASWSAPPDEKSVPQTVDSQQAQRIGQGISLLEKYILLREIKPLKAATGSNDLMIERLLQMDDAWSETRILELLKEILLNEHTARGVSKDAIAPVIKNYSMELTLLEVNKLLNNGGHS